MPRARARPTTIMGALALAVTAGSLALLPAGAAAQSAARTRPPAVLLILDASGSMDAPLGGSTRLAVAKQAVRSVVGGLPSESLVGLRVYGGRVEDPQRGCRDTRLVAPVRRRGAGDLVGRLRAISARGPTPIGRSLEAAQGDLPGGGSRTVILVSDGIDTCAPPPPCRVARDLRRAGVRVDVIGFRINRQARAQLRCIARAGRGRFVDARSARQLTARLQRLALRAVRTVELAGRRVSGGPPGKAPMLDQGRYVDRIAGNGDRWYAVDLERGQSVEVTATLVGDALGPRSRFGTFALRLYTPEGESPLDGRAVSSFTGLATTTASASGPRVGLDGSAASWSRTGRHYIQLTLDDAPELRSHPYPVAMQVSIDGEVVRRPAPEPSRPLGWIFIAGGYAIAGALLGGLATRTIRAVVDR